MSLSDDIKPVRLTLLLYYSLFRMLLQPDCRICNYFCLVERSLPGVNDRILIKNSDLGNSY